MMGQEEGKQNNEEQTPETLLCLVHSGATRQERRVPKNRSLNFRIKRVLKDLFQ